VSIIKASDILVSCFKKKNKALLLSHNSKTNISGDCQYEDMGEVLTAFSDTRTMRDTDVKGRWGNSAHL